MKNQEKIKIDGGVYLKKDHLFGTHYRLIYPLRKEDGTLNKFNLCTGGSYWNLIKVIIFVLLMIGLILAYKNDMRSCVKINEKLAAKCMEIELNNPQSNQLNILDMDWGSYIEEVEGDGVG